MSKCLYCYKELADGEVDFHKGCCKKFFGIPEAPELPYSLDELDTLAAQVIQSQTTLTGVQAKLSLHLDRHDGLKRLTIVGLWGDYIFKPQTQSYKTLPENEDLTMHLCKDSQNQSRSSYIDPSQGWHTRISDQKNRPFCRW